MALMIPKKRLGGPPMPPREMMRQQVPVNEDDYDELDFGDGGCGAEEEGMLEASKVTEASAELPTSVFPTQKKPHKKALVQASSAENSSVTAHKVPLSKRTTDTPVSSRSQLSCQLSRDLHRRLKIYSIVSGRSISAVVEGWVEEHCPPL